MYFIRIDDLRPWMDKEILENIISFFDKLNIKPLLAIIPDWPEDDEFWNVIKKLQSKWYVIWLHWFNHQLEKNPVNSKSIIPIQNFSEFVWKSIEEQENKIKEWLEIFEKNWIKTNIFVAPAHWLDKNTLKVLKKYWFKYVSDWFFLYPKKINWLIFLPQQLWQFRNIPFWYKTICLHLEDFESIENNYILENIKKNKEKFADYEKFFHIKVENIFQKILNYIFEKIWFLLLKIKRW